MFCRRKSGVKIPTSASCNSRTAFLESQQNIANNFTAACDAESGLACEHLQRSVEPPSSDVLVKVHNRAPNNIETAAARVVTPLSAERAHWTRDACASPSRPQQLLPLKDYKLYSNKLLDDGKPVTSSALALDARPLCSSFDVDS